MGLPDTTHCTANTMRMTGPGVLIVPSSTQSTRPVHKHGWVLRITANVARRWRWWLPLVLFGLVRLWELHRVHVSFLATAGAVVVTLPVAWWCWRLPTAWLWAMLQPHTLPAWVRGLHPHANVDGAFRDVGLVGDDEGVVVLDHRDSSTGVEIDVRVPKGRSVAEIEAKAGHLADALGAEAVVVLRSEPGVATLRLRTKADPLLEGAGVWPWGTSGTYSPSPRSILDAVPLARAEDGSLVSLDLYCSQLLVGGMTGGGKSVALWLAVLGAGALPPEPCLIVFDGKGGMELGALRRSGRADVFVTDPGAGVVVLRRILAELQRRMVLLEQVGARKLDRTHWTTVGPPLVLVIDELAEWTASGERERDKEYATLLRRCVNVGRACGLSVLAATQRPSADVVPTGFRDMCSYRWSMRTSNPAMSSIILGDWLPKEVGPHTIPPGPKYAGVSVLADESGRWRRVRSFLLDNDEVEHLCHQAAVLHQRSGFEFELPLIADGAGPANATGMRRRRPPRDSQD